MLGNDCIFSCKLNYHTIMTTTAPSEVCVNGLHGRCLIRDRNCYPSWAPVFIHVVSCKSYCTSFWFSVLYIFILFVFILSSLVPNLTSGSGLPLQFSVTFILYGVYIYIGIWWRLHIIVIYFFSRKTACYVTFQNCFFKGSYAFLLWRGAIMATIVW